MIELGDQLHHIFDKRLFAFFLAWQPSDTLTYSANIVNLFFSISYGMGIDVGKYTKLRAMEKCMKIVNQLAFHKRELITTCKFC